LFEQFPEAPVELLELFPHGVAPLVLQGPRTNNLNLCQCSRCLPWA